MLKTKCQSDETLSLWVCKKKLISQLLLSSEHEHWTEKLGHENWKFQFKLSELICELINDVTYQHQQLSHRKYHFSFSCASLKCVVCNNANHDNVSTFSNFEFSHYYVTMVNSWTSLISSITRFQLLLKFLFTTVLLQSENCMFLRKVLMKFIIRIN